MEQIKLWEVKNKIMDTTVNRIKNAMESQFPAFEAEIGDIEREMTGKSDVSSYECYTTEEDEISILPDFLNNAFLGLSTFKRILLGIGLSPILLAGSMVRLPYLAVKVFQKFSIESGFKAASNNLTEKKKTCEKYAEQTVKTILKNLNLNSIIEEDTSVLFEFLKAQRQRMQEQIIQDSNLLNTLKSEECDDKEVEKNYNALYAECKTLKHHLRHFMLMYTPSLFPKRSKMNCTLLETIVCSGLIADIVVAEITEQGREKSHVCVRRVKPRARLSDTLHFTATLQKCRYRPVLNFAFAGITAVNM